MRIRSTTLVLCSLLTAAGAAGDSKDRTTKSKEREKAAPKEPPDDTTPKGCPNNGNDVTDVFIVINSLGFVDDNNNPVWRRLELVWVANVEEDDQVLLYNSCEPGPTTDAVITINAVSYPDKFFTTSITIPKFDFKATPAVPKCLGYCAEYRRDGLVISTNCLSTQPNWMSAMSDDIRSFYLHQVMLPGVHNAGSYNDYLGRVSDNDIIFRFGSAQEETLYSQFYLGARYFNVSVMFDPGTTERFWVSYGDMRIRPFTVIIEDLFIMMEACKEIIIFEIGGFHGAFNSTPTAYNELLNLFVPRMQQWLVPMPVEAIPTVLLSDLWDTDNRLVLVWDHQPTWTDYFWSRVNSSWNNDNTADGLYATLQRAVAQGPPQQLFALAGEMTPHPDDIVDNKVPSLRWMANVVNRNVSRMVRYDWWDKTNIVTADYFMGTYNVDTALLVNKQRATCQPAAAEGGKK